VIVLFVSFFLLTNSSSISQIQYGPPPYGGPPMWSRRREDYPSGPQMEPCIYYGNCRDPYRRRFGPPMMPPGPPPPPMGPPPPRFYDWD